MSLKESLESEIMKKVIMYMVMAFLAVVGTLSGWVVKTVYVHENKIVSIETNITNIKVGIDDIKRMIAERKR